MDLLPHKIRSIPDSVFYMPDFITEDEEKSLMHQVNSAPKPKWTQLSNRRLQNWGGLPHSKGMVPEPLPGWLLTYCKKVADLGVFDGKVPNHVLVNEYLPGQGIMPHTDGPLYFPTVSTISLGSHTVLDFFRPITGNDENAADCSTELWSRHVASVLLEPRSLVVIRDEMYSLYLHGIQEQTSDVVTDKLCNKGSLTASPGSRLERGIRVSLTIRVVPKVLKANILFGGRR